MIEPNEEDVVCFCGKRKGDHVVQTTYHGSYVVLEGIDFCYEKGPQRFRAWYSILDAWYSILDGWEGNYKDIEEPK